MNPENPKKEPPAELIEFLRERGRKSRHATLCPMFVGPVNEEQLNSPTGVRGTLQFVSDGRRRITQLTLRRANESQLALELGAPLLTEPLGIVIGKELSFFDAEPVEEILEFPDEEAGQPEIARATSAAQQVSHALAAQGPVVTEPRDLSVKFIAPNNELEISAVVRRGVVPRHVIVEVVALDEPTFCQTRLVRLPGVKGELRKGIVTLPDLQAFGPRALIRVRAVRPDNADDAHLLLAEAGFVALPVIEQTPSTMIVDFRWAHHHLAVVDPECGWTLKVAGTAKEVN